MKTYEGLKEYIYAKSRGLTLITQDVLDEANIVCENLMQNKDIQLIFSQLKDVQKEVKWNDNGWFFIGYLDMLLDNALVTFQNIEAGLLLESLALLSAFFIVFIVSCDLPTILCISSKYFS